MKIFRPEGFLTIFQHLNTSPPAMMPLLYTTRSDKVSYSLEYNHKFIERLLEVQHIQRETINQVVILSSS